MNQVITAFQFCVKFYNLIKLVILKYFFSLHQVNTNDIYDDMAEQMHLYDLSNYPVNLKLHSLVNKKKQFSNLKMNALVSILLSVFVV